MKLNLSMEKTGKNLHCFFFLQKVLLKQTFSLALLPSLHVVSWSRAVVDGNSVSPQQASHEGIMSLNDLLEPSDGDHVTALRHLKD